MKPVVLAILDGWGYSTKHLGNPILEAQKPNFDTIEARYPLLLLQASGIAVGLNMGEFGNSEVGHLTIGAGRVVQQYSLRIEKEIKDGSFERNSVLQEVFGRSRVHIIGLLTAGNVHASMEHIRALLEMGKTSNSQTFLHLFTDGKDSGIQEGASLLNKLGHTPTTIIGRNFGMDRDNNWELTEKAYQLIAHGVGEKTADFTGALTAYYEKGFPDTKIPALVEPGYTGIHAGDSLFFFNFREDSIRQLYKKFAVQKDILVATMTKYTEDDDKFVVSPPNLANNLAEVLSSSSLSQLHIAETLKYAHVTYFFNGLRNTPFSGEQDILIPSVKDIEFSPTMGATQIAETIVKSLDSYDFILANFANADMLAHTGNYEATKLGVEAIDTAIGSILAAVLERNGVLLITSDHGNAETLIDRVRSEPESRHDSSPVPLYLVSKDFDDKHYKSDTIEGMLADVAPTVLELLNIPQPIEMTGVSLLPKLRSRGT